MTTAKVTYPYALLKLEERRGYTDLFIIEVDTRSVLAANKKMEAQKHGLPLDRWSRTYAGWIKGPFTTEVTYL